MRIVSPAIVPTIAMAIGALLLVSTPLPGQEVVGRLGTLEFRHATEIEGTAVSPDGKTLACTGWDETALWDLKTGKKIVQFPKESGVLVGFADQGKLLITLLESGTLRYRDAATGKIVHQAELARGGVDSAAITPDGRFLAYSDGDNACVWDIAARAVKSRMAPQKSGPLGISPDGQRLAVGNNPVEIYDTATEKVVNALPAKKGDIRNIRQFLFSPDARTLYFSGECGTGVRAWDLASGNERLLDEAEDLSYFGRMAVSTDGKRLAWYLKGRELRVTLMDTRTGKTRSWPAPRGCFDQPMMFTPDGGTLIISDLYGVIRRWDVASGTEISTAPGLDSAARFLAASADGRFLATKGSTGRIVLWDAREKSLVAEFPDATPGFYDVHSGFAFPPLAPFAKLQIFTYIHKDQSIRFCNAATGRELRRIRVGNAGAEQGDPDAVRTLAFSKDGSVLFTVHTDGTLRSRRLADDVEIDSRLLPAEPQHFSRDGSLLLRVKGEQILGGFSGTLRVWDAGRGEPLGPTEKLELGHSVVAAFSPDAREYAAATHGGVCIFESATGKKRLALQQGGGDISSAVVYSADGRLLAVAAQDAFEIWDPTAGKLVHSQPTDQRGVRSLAFVGDLLAVGGRDTTVVLWDIAAVRRKLGK